MSKYLTMPIKKTNHSYDLDRCLVEWERIQFRLGSKLYDSHKFEKGQNLQTCVQRREKSIGNQYTDGLGADVDWTDGKWHPNDGAYQYYQKRFIVNQSDFRTLNEIYEGTVFADMIHDVDGERARIMHMNPCTSYSVHRDNSPRYHAALITNPNAYFVFPTLNEVIHIPADGFLYEVDTTILHTFVNCGPERTHLIISKPMIKDH